ncbi:unnamed protein product [Protopolystoma xenopodis]|uniref:Uncharacterized protein n=1 Tax=Protopolystoma xenopodis TaxID=117903 RepID=A0A3S4ZLG4_9PLAT|nr:unnamed protein product [Protopolystoma xenopodis]
MATRCCRQSIEPSRACHSSGAEAPVDAKGVLEQADEQKSRCGNRDGLIVLPQLRGLRKRGTVACARFAVYAETSSENDRRDEKCRSCRPSVCHCSVPAGSINWQPIEARFRETSLRSTDRQTDRQTHVSSESVRPGQVYMLAGRVLFKVPEAKGEGVE